MFAHPFRLDLSARIEHDLPDPFKDALKKPKAKVLPLATKEQPGTLPGWCSYPGPLDAPDIEILSGGLNAKTIDAAGLWRQGHLLHFGFDIHAQNFSDNGRKLFLNSIHYIARFTEDRPSLRIPGFGTPSPRARDSLARWLDAEGHRLEWFKDRFHALPTDDRAELKKWFMRVSPYLYPDEDAKFHVDEFLQTKGIANHDPKIFQLAQDPEGRKALRRYLPPDAPEDPAALTQWIEKRKDALFFSDWGGYRWYVDELALKRGVPTAKLRGEARADLAEAPR